MTSDKKPIITVHENGSVVVDSKVDYELKYQLLSALVVTHFYKSYAIFHESGFEDIAKLCLEKVLPNKQFTANDFRHVYAMHGTNKEKVKQAIEWLTKVPPNVNHSLVWSAAKHPVTLRWGQVCDMIDSGKYDKLPPDVLAMIDWYVELFKAYLFDLKKKNI